ncbi:MAG: hypothetical protein Kow00120_20100 [Anaerolineae bacterium]
MQRATRTLSVTVSLLILGALLALPAGAQEMMGAPSVAVADQLSLDGTVTIASAYSEGPGFIVIHIDNGSGGPGPVIGSAPLATGWNYNVRVAIDTRAATPTLFAMLHTDTGEVGVYEFGAVEGADGPVIVDGSPVTPPFNVQIVHALDQFVSGNQVTIDSITTDAPGWIVIHADGDGRPGPVLGQTFVEAGTTTDVVVDLSDAATDVLWPMLHRDTGEAGVYEFGAVEGADGPVNVDGRVAVLPIWTVPHIRVADQVVTDTLVADSVLSSGPGFLVVHQDADGRPGPVIGVAPVEDGLNTGVTVPVAADSLTSVVWPMLHVNDSDLNAYEFGEVEGADAPVRVGDAVVMLPVNAAPALVMADQPLHEEDGAFYIQIEKALIDTPGWLVVHSSADGAPGPVIAHTPLHAGLNLDVRVAVDPMEAGAQVFPMLHYDTGEAGVYEFGAVEGADAPVVAGGGPVVGPLNILSAEGEEASMGEGAETMLDGAALVAERCTVCHTADRIDNASKDAAGWTATVDRMIGHGAQLDDAERAAVIEYLASR